jgi:hypothetical protein
MTELTITHAALHNFVDRANRLNFDRDTMCEATERWAQRALAFEVGDWGTDPGCPLRQAGLEPGGDEVEGWVSTFDRLVLEHLGLSDEAIEDRTTDLAVGEGVLVVVVAD